MERVMFWSSLVWFECVGINSCLLKILDFWAVLTFIFWWKQINMRAKFPLNCQAYAVNITTSVKMLFNAFTGLISWLHISKSVINSHRLSLPLEVCHFYSYFNYSFFVPLAVSWSELWVQRVSDESWLTYIKQRRDTAARWCNQSSVLLELSGGVVCLRSFSLLFAFMLVLSF